ncbi:MAG: tRNA (adenosine(37)-N6)-threonylcarbamoyltransferase complex transferase subunit TsaD [Gemmatimonadota bacterium]|nr:tRNA (adenosine(37)-N6)-threonylcarbamoyltransferase complex transferase subunit TsaD [Gemmatimonadota bacterium]
MRVLGIETSCDETSAAIVEGDGTGAATIRSLAILSQEVHAIFGGVVPELASREHLRGLVPVVDATLGRAGMEFADVDAIAVTAGPGLVGALLVGVSYAKALAARLARPLIGVHHMEGHLFATMLESADAVPPFTALLVSGGHTLLVDVPAWGTYRTLGATRDDAAGEAFDKAAKLLGLPYPGGPAIERLATTVAPDAAVRFPRPMLHGGQRRGDDDWYDVSFSGLKTAVRLAAADAAAHGRLEAARGAIARGFQDAVVETLAAKVARAVRDHGRPRVVIGGGVAGNRALLEAIRASVGPGVVVHAPSARLATDNAAMIAAAGLWRLARGERSGPELVAFAGGPLPGAG